MGVTLRDATEIHDFHSLLLKVSIRADSVLGTNCQVKSLKGRIASFSCSKVSLTKKFLHENKSGI